MHFRVYFLLAVLVHLAAASSLATDVEFTKTVESFASEYCYDCHDNDTQKGDFNFVTLSRDLSDPKNAVQWQDLLDLVRGNEMPPKKKARPAAEDLEKFTAAVESALRHEVEKSGQNDRIAIRRLSHSALDNAAADLLGVSQHLSDGLPPDVQVGGFDNMAETMGQSTEFLTPLQANARRIAREAIADGPDPRGKRTYGLEKINSGSRVVKQDGMLVISSNRDRNDCVDPKGFTAPATGLYRISITAFERDNQAELRAAGKTWSYGDDKFGQRIANAARNPLPPERPRQAAVMASEPGEKAAKAGGGASTGGRRVGTIQIDATLGTHSTVCALKEGEMIFIHGMDTPRLQKPSVAAIDGRTIVVGEGLYLNQIGVEGPLLESWPSRVQKALTSDSKDDSLMLNGESLTGLRALLTRAFRCKVSEEVLARYEGLFQSSKDAGISTQDAWRNVIEAILCSPHFLYNQPLIEQENNRAWALASRLSFFLWNSIPDDTLLGLAASGELEKPVVIEAQVRRMLADPKLGRFVVDFTGQWLGLRKVGAMLPDPKLYPDYDPVLEDSMRHETEELFRHILVENRPVTDFLNPGYAMLNERLARHYGIEGVSGREFRRVALTPNNPRGGLLGQASMLTITSNGTRTSPVMRGIWLLENLLDSPPPPPPPNVEPLEPDVRGAKTIREMLAKHRENEGCAGCHSRIDPWGFSLEHFDAIGAWRDVYKTKVQATQPKTAAQIVTKPIDAAAELTDGHTFDGVIGLRDTMVARSDRFTFALSAKLLAHALGHPTTLREKLLLEELVKQHRTSGGGFADLIAALCTSAPFLGN